MKRGLKGQGRSGWCAISARRLRRFIWMMGEDCVIFVMVSGRGGLLGGRAVGRVVVRVSSDCGMVEGVCG